MMNKYNYVIFHKGCLDGFSSFIILNKTKKIDRNATINPDVPSAKIIPKNIEGKNIIIMDVAYKYEILKEIVNSANHVTFIDHHITIHDDVKKIKNDELLKHKITMIYDEYESGASLTWKYFHPKKHFPLFIKYIKDNDIGTWKMRFTHEFIASLEVNYNTTLSFENINNWNKLFSSKNVKHLIKTGKTYKQYIDYLTDYNANKYSYESFPSQKIYENHSDYFLKPGQYKVAVYCGSGCPSTSYLSIKMLNSLDCDFVIMWSLNIDKKEYVLSFRSKKVDVGKIAQLFGGGGHTLASACSFPITKYSILDLFFPQSIPRM